MFDVIGKEIGRYRIIELIGEGGMAMVYKAHDSRLDREVAIKFIRMGVVEDAYTHDMLKRFDREARALARLSHPNIVKVYDYGEYENVPYLVMEYLAGGTLRSRIGKTMPFNEAARLLVPITRALEYAHQQGIVHRDVKPTNILLSATGDPLLSDFGIAKLLHAGEAMTLTGPGASVGTPEYTAPEQSTGKPVDHRVDIYSLGVVLYELVTGEKPFTADTPVAVMVKHVLEPLPSPRKYISDLPDDVERVILKALAKEPDDRYQTMKSLGVDLEKLSIVERGLTPTLSRRRSLMKEATSPSPLPKISEEIAAAAKSHPQAVPHTTPVSTVPMAKADQSEPAPIPAKTVIEDLSASPPPAKQVVSGARVKDQAPSPVDQDAVETLELVKTAAPVSQPITDGAKPGTPVPGTPVSGIKSTRQSLLWGAAALVILCILTIGGGALYLRGLGEPPPSTGQPTIQAVEPSDQTAQAEQALAVTSSSTEPDQGGDKPATSSPDEQGETVIEVADKQEQSPNLGPFDGSLAHKAEGSFVSRSAGVDLRNFTSQVVFFNPYTVKLGVWDVGFFFRAKGENEGYHIVVRGDSTWQLVYQNGDSAETVNSGRIAKMVMSDTADQANKLSLTILNDEGYLFVNDIFVGQFNLTRKSDPGDVMIETGHFPGSQREGIVTRYKGFTIWPIEEGRRVEDGELVYGENELDTQASGVELDNFVMRAFFKVPYSVTLGKWNLGIVFRSHGRNDEYRLIITSTADWLLGDQNPRLSQMTTVTSGRLEGILQLGDNKENELLLIVQGAKGYFFLNGEFIKGLDLSKRITAGDVAIAAGFYHEGAIMNKTVVYRDFTVWDLPQNSAIEALMVKATDTALEAAKNEPVTPTPKPEHDMLIPPVKVFGPLDGNFNLEADAPVQQHAAGVNLSDFAAQVTFRNPFSAAVGRWDTGFLFRSSDQEGYRLVLRADSTWELIDLKGETSQVIGSSERSRTKIRTLDNTAGNTNKILLIALADKGFFFVNDAYITDLYLKRRTTAGDVIFESGFGEGSQKDDFSTAFSNYSVWEIGQPGLGPMNGETRHNQDGTIKYRYAGVSVKNFVARASFSNPYPATRGKWDAGFAFRSAANDNQYQLVVLAGPSGSEWRFGNRQPNLSTTSWLQTKPLKGELAIGYPATNELFVLVYEKKGYFFLNDKYIDTVDLSAHPDAGDVAIGSGFFRDSEIDGSITKYEGYTLWELP